MHSTRKVKDDLIYVGGSDRRLSRFENLFPIPKGVSYNSYVLLDEKTVLFDTADSAVAEIFFENLDQALAGRALDYVVVSHMEPDHAALLFEVANRYPGATFVLSAMALNMMKQFLTNGKILLTQDQIPMFFPDAADMITSVLIWATVMLYSSPPLIFILYSMTLPLYI